VRKFITLHPEITVNNYTEQFNLKEKTVIYVTVHYIHTEGGKMWFEI